MRRCVRSKCVLVVIDLRADAVNAAAELEDAEVAVRAAASESPYREE